MNYRDILGMSDKKPKKKLVKKHKPSVTEGLKKQFGDVINEGPAYEYANYVKQIEKTENLQAKAVNKFVKVLEKKGFKSEARNVAYTYMTSMRKFNDYLKELVDKLL
tara:strand:+ start:428 stop:748 length:321 start_codon:yes stop_codon:yes gene_type:complete